MRLGTISVCKDISQRLRSEKALKERNKILLEEKADLEELLSIISHDLRSPLATISGYASLMERRPESLSQQETRQSARAIVNKARETAERLEDLLQVFRLSFTPPGVPRELDVEQVLLECIQECLGRDGGEELALDIPKELPRLVGQRGHLAMILNNLLSNASKFAHFHPEPRIKVTHAEEEVDGKVFQVFTIADNGIGIPESFRKNLFTLFSRADRDARVPGAGVGLVAVRRLVTQNGGLLGVTSREGEGTKICFSLPWPRA